MNTLIIICQIIIALGIFNVWLLRLEKSTIWRGGEANNMQEEFAVYGLPAWLMKGVGGLKLILAVCLLLGVFLPVIVQPAAVGMAFLMLGAVSMHFKVGDQLRKSLPAICMLLLSLVVAFAQ
jgi:uncharacterized membrane protein HdeD (DUF308 family)